MLQEPIINFEQIPLTEAAVLTENWQKENVLKAFLFHKNDIECLAQQTAVVGVRFYPGIVTNNEGEVEPDMIVVGVNSLNQDLIYDNINAAEISEVSGLYNFALPCPKLCDPESELFHNGDEIKVSNTRTSYMKTVQHSTEEECMINLGAISVEDAVNRVRIWQCDMNKELISIYFNIEDLDSIFRVFSDANALRVYFGLEGEAHRVILIGASNSEKKYYEDIKTEEVFVNVKAPCTGNGEGSCNVRSILYRPCN